VKPMTLIHTMAAAFTFVALGLSPAAAHQQGKRLHLADAPLDQQVEAISYCQGVYRVTTKQGASIEYPEFDVRFKTDSSENGPRPGTPVVVNAGMRGDRGFVIFSNPEDASAFLKTSC